MRDSWCLRFSSGPLTLGSNRWTLVSEKNLNTCLINSTVVHTKVLMTSNQMGLAEAIVESVSACDPAARPWLYRCKTISGIRTWTSVLYWFASYKRDRCSAARFMYKLKIKITTGLWMSLKLSGKSCWLEVTCLFLGWRRGFNRKSAPLRRATWRFDLDTKYDFPDVIIFRFR